MSNRLISSAIKNEKHAPLYVYRQQKAFTPSIWRSAKERQVLPKTKTIYAAFRGCVDLSGKKSLKRLMFLNEGLLFHKIF